MTSAEKLQEFEAGQSGIRGNFLLPRFLVPGVWTRREERTAITFMQTVQYGTGDVGTTNRVFICKKMCVLAHVRAKRDCRQKISAREIMFLFRVSAHNCPF